MARKFTLHQRLPEGLMHIAERISADPRLSNLIAQIQAGEIDESVLMQLTSKRKDLEGRPEALNKFDNLVNAIADSIRGKVFKTSDSHPTVQTRVPYTQDADETKTFNRVLIPTPKQEVPTPNPDASADPLLNQLKQFLETKGIIVTKRLGEGGMGAVYNGYRKFHDETVGEVVIKVIKDSTEESRLAFKKESVTMMRAEGPHIVSVYDAGLLPNNDPYLVMDFIKGPEGGRGVFDGDALLKIIQRNKEVRPVTPDATSIVLYCMALGIKETHDLGIVHRDLKPANFLLTPKAAELFDNWDREEIDDDKLIGELHVLMQSGNPIVLLTDFGLAKEFDNTKRKIKKIEEIKPPKVNTTSIEFTFTAEGGVCGTPKYIAPEALAAQSYAEKTDLYALGAIIGEMFKGEFPFKFKNNNTLNVFSEVTNLALGIGGVAPRPSLVAADDPDLLKLPKHLKPIHPLSSKLSSLDPNAPKKRGNINEAVAVLKTCVEASSAKGRELAKLKKFGGGIAGVVALAVLSVLSYMPIADKNKRKEDFLKEHTQRMENLDEQVSSNNWEMVIQLLNAEIKIMEANENLDDEEKAEKVGNLRERLSRASSAHEQAVEQARRTQEELETQRQAKVEVKAAAERLIVEGDELANRADFTGAIEKYNEAASVSEEKRVLTNEKIAVARFRSGVRAYRSGDLENFTNYLSQAREQNYEGLSEEQKNVLNQLAGRVENWSSVEPGLRMEALNAIGITLRRENGLIKAFVNTPITDDEWNVRAARLFKSAQNGEENSMYRLVTVLFFLTKYIVDPHFRGDTDARLSDPLQQRFVNFSGRLLVLLPELEDQLDDSPALSLLTQNNLVSIANVTNGSADDLVRQLMPIGRRMRELRELKKSEELMPNQQRELEELSVEAERISPNLEEIVFRMIETVASIERIRSLPDSDLLPINERTTTETTVRQIYLTLNALLGNISEEKQAEFNKRIDTGLNGVPLAPFLDGVRGRKG